MGWRSLAVGAAIVVMAAMAGNDLFNRRLRVDVHSDWESLSPDLRASGREDALAGPGHMVLRLPGLKDSDEVELTLMSRPGLEPLTTILSRDDAEPARVIVGRMPLTIRVPPGRGTEVTLNVAAMDSPRRPVYLFHLLEIVVLRTGSWPSVRPWVPALTALLIFGACWRARGLLMATLWSLVGVTLAVAGIRDPLASVASDGRWAWICGLIALLGAAKIVLEPRWRTLPKVTLGCGLVLLMAVMAHVPGLNGPDYWQWRWQRLDWITVFGATIFASTPLFVARALYREGSAGLPFLLALISAGVLASATAVMAVQPEGLTRMHAVIKDPMITSYYTDALDLALEPRWMASYPQRLSSLHLHSKTKPAGPTLFYVALIHALGPASLTAAVGALLIALGAALGVPSVYVLARQLGEPPSVAFEAACVMAMSPSLRLFFPEFDLAFPLLTCMVLASWRRAMDGGLRAAVACGLSAFLATFFSYSFLTLGVSGLVLAVGHMRNAGRAAIRVGLVVCAVYGALYSFAGFDPIATFRAALENQTRLSTGLGRPYVAGLLNDPLDFALGVGWLSLLLAGVAVVRALRKKDRDITATTATLQIVAVNLSGLLRVEAARVWFFLAPLVAIPAARELANWTPGESASAYLMMVMLLAALAQNMNFLF